MKQYLKIKKWHTRGCSIEGTERLYYFPTGKMFFGNYAGNEKGSNNYYWIEMQCNDTQCGFLGLIDSNYLDNFIKA